MPIVYVVKIIFNRIVHMSIIYDYFKIAIRGVYQFSYPLNF